MRHSATGRALAVLLMTVAWPISAPAADAAPTKGARDSAGQAKGSLVTEGRSSYQRDRKKAAKKTPELHLTTEIPPGFDPDSSDSVELDCIVFAGTDPVTGVAEAAGQWSIDFWVLDLPAGTFERMTAGSGSLETNIHGLAFFGASIDSAIFADGFESGDTAAWASTRVKFTDRSKVAWTDAACFVRTKG